VTLITMALSTEFFMLSVANKPIMPSVIVLNVIMLSAVMISVAIMGVVAPRFQLIV
jgi:hypothetical protein